MPQFSDISITGFDTVSSVVRGDSGEYHLSISRPPPEQWTAHFNSEYGPLFSFDGKVSCTGDHIVFKGREDTVRSEDFKRKIKQAVNETNASHRQHIGAVEQKAEEARQQEAEARQKLKDLNDTIKFD